MNKTISFVLFAMVFAIGMSAFASAWHCVDSDQARPNHNNGLYGTWGDNGQLGGTSYFWLNPGPVPQGCTGTQANYVCTDQCIEGSLREFYCGDWVGHRWDTVIFWHDYPNAAQCSNNDVPEFGVAGMIVVLVGTLVGIVAIRSRN